MRFDTTSRANTASHRIDTMWAFRSTSRPCAAGAMRLRSVMASNASLTALAGLFITLEGIVGAAIVAYLGYSSPPQRAPTLGGANKEEPGGTPPAQSLRVNILHEPIDTLAKVLLNFAARRDYLAKFFERLFIRHHHRLMIASRSQPPPFNSSTSISVGCLCSHEQWVQEACGRTLRYG